MPKIAEGLARGDVGVCHARKLARLATNPRTCAAFADDEAELSDAAESMSWPAFCRKLAYWEQQADPDGPELRAGRDEWTRAAHWRKGAFAHVATA
jgi:hypothetical protein